MQFRDVLTAAIDAALDGEVELVVVHRGSDDPEDHVDSATCPCRPVTLLVSQDVLSDEQYEAAIRVIPRAQPEAASPEAT